MVLFALSCFSILLAFCGTVSATQEHEAAWRYALESGRRAEARYQSQCRRLWASNRRVNLGTYTFSEPRSTWYPTPFDDIIARRRVFQVNVDHSRGALDFHSRTDTSPYQNLFDPSRGLIICDHNFNNDDRHNPRLQLSNLLFKSYSKAARQQHPQRNGGHAAPGRISRLLPFGQNQWPPPRFIVRTSIATPATILVLEKAYRRRSQQATMHGVRQPEARVHDRSWTAVEEFTPGEEAFHALLGTIHGKSILYMLADHCKWAQRRRVRSVRITEALERNGRMESGWYMLIELET